MALEKGYIGCQVFEECRRRDVIAVGIGLEAVFDLPDQMAISFMLVSQGNHFTFQIAFFFYDQHADFPAWVVVIFVFTHGCSRDELWIRFI